MGIIMNRFLKMTAEDASMALRPKLVDGKWKKPMISKRQQSFIKKQAAKNGLMGQWVPGQGGWLMAWETPDAHRVMRPPKGHLRHRNVAERVEKIQKAMADMPKKVEEHKKAVKAAKPLKGLEKWLNAK